MDVSVSCFSLGGGMVGCVRWVVGWMFRWLSVGAWLLGGCADVSVDRGCFLGGCMCVSECGGWFGGCVGR